MNQHIKDQHYQINLFRDFSLKSVIYQVKL